MASDSLKFYLAKIFSPINFIINLSKFCLSKICACPIHFKVFPDKVLLYMHTSVRHKHLLLQLLTIKKCTNTMLLLLLCKFFKFFL